ncbi:MAG: hypothetical protein Q7W45_04800 [Bacteroidota bacterium]|nr:hypothetical protein [Bacteroidota bacterium]MDP3144764.1 hypothetical protein [Bacteroidota bacterium]
MRKFSSVLIFGLSLTLFFTSCKKKEKEEDTETVSASESSLANSIDNDMNNIADEAGRTKNISSYKTSENNSIMSSCATLKFDTLVNTNADSITINFGNVNCVCLDGRLRKGSLLIIYNGKYKDSLTTITVRPINYYVNNNKVDGGKTIKNLGHNAAGHLVYEINATISILKADNSGTIQWSGLRYREWLAGESTLIWSDDKYSLTGNASGSNANGRSYSSVITSGKPLIRDMSLPCRKHFISGELRHTPEGKPARIIDFGDGTCDDKATVTINSKTYTITLP